eukprot:EG_transcript_18825
MAFPIAMPPVPSMVPQYTFLQPSQPYMVEVGQPFPYIPAYSASNAGPTNGVPLVPTWPGVPPQGPWLTPYAQLYGPQPPGAGVYPHPPTYHLVRPPAGGGRSRSHIPFYGSWDEARAAGLSFEEFLWSQHLTKHLNFLEATDPGVSEELVQIRQAALRHGPRSAWDVSAYPSPALVPTWPGSPVLQPHWAPAYGSPTLYSRGHHPPTRLPPAQEELLAHLGGRDPDELPFKERLSFSWHGAFLGTTFYHKSQFDPEVFGMDEEEYRARLRVWQRRQKAGDPN